MSFVPPFLKNTTGVAAVNQTALLAAGQASVIGAGGALVAGAGSADGSASAIFSTLPTTEGALSTAGQASAILDAIATGQATISANGSSTPIAVGATVGNVGAGAASAAGSSSVIAVGSSVLPFSILSATGGTVVGASSINQSVTIPTGTDWVMFGYIGRWTYAIDITSVRLGGNAQTIFTHFFGGGACYGWYSTDVPSPGSRTLYVPFYGAEYGAWGLICFSKGNQAGPGTITHDTFPYGGAWANYDPDYGGLVGSSAVGNVGTSNYGDTVAHVSSYYDSATNRTYAQCYGTNADSSAQLDLGNNATSSGVCRGWYITKQT